MLRRFCLEREVPHRSWKLNSVEGGIVGDHCRFQVVYLAIQDRFSWQFRIFLKHLAATGGHWRLLVLHQGICGKLIVATSEAQLPELKALEMKARTHGEIGEGTTTPPESQGIYWCAARDKHCFKIIKVSDRKNFYQLVLWNKNPTDHSKTSGVYFPMVFRVFSDQWRWGCRQRGEVGALEPAASAADGAGGWRWLPIHSDYPDSQNDICMYIYI